MKKFLHDVKSAVGTAPKTQDDDFDAKDKSTKEINAAFSEFQSAVDRMKTSFNSAISAMESVNKAIKRMSAIDGVSSDVKTLNTDFEAMLTKAKDTLTADYKKELENDSNIEIAKLGQECKKLSEAREKARAEYDTYRDEVAKKEEKYGKKGKDLAESKVYEEDVANRDKSKEEYEKANEEFKTKAAELEGMRNKQFLLCITQYFDATSKFVDALNTEVSNVSKKAKAAKP